MRVCARLPLLLALWAALALGAAAGPGLASEGAEELEVLRAEIVSEDGNTRRKAAEGLGACGDPAAVPLLAEAYRAEGRDAFGVKAACAEALGRTGRPEAAQPLGEMLGDPDYWVRRKAAEALAHVPGEGATTILLRAAADPDPRVRAQALLSLASRRESRPALEAGLRDADDRVAAAAVEALAQWEGEGTRALLADAAKSPAWRVRLRAASALLRRGDPLGGQVLREEIVSGAHGGTALREAAAAGAAAVPLLRDLYRDPGLVEPERVLDALEGVEGREAGEFFVSLALDAAAPAPHRLRGASSAFDRRAELAPAQVERLAGLLEAQDPNLVGVALQLLGEGGGASHLSRIALLASHENPVLRHFALVNLARYGGPEHEAHLVEALSDPNGANVRLALEGLGRVGSAAALPPIRSLGQDVRLRRYAQAAAEAIEARR
ncbi:MAG: HEAT repeat domain-containing protein [Thermodesulfobacteriota bacterium]